jgi:hypothetical protein
VGVAVVADIHGNFLALECVHHDLGRRSVDRVINLGDCVSGPLWPRETADLLMKLGRPTVRGNHDRWVTEWPRDKQYPSDAYVFSALGRTAFEWLKSLPSSFELGNEISLFTVVLTTTMPICSKTSRDVWVKRLPTISAIEPARFVLRSVRPQPCLALRLFGRQDIH